MAAFLVRSAGYVAGGSAIPLYSSLSAENSMESVFAPPCQRHKEPKDRHRRTGDPQRLFRLRLPRPEPRADCRGSPLRGPPQQAAILRVFAILTVSCANHISAKSSSHPPPCTEDVSPSPKDGCNRRQILLSLPPIFLFGEGLISGRRARRRNLAG